MNVLVIGGAVSGVAAAGLARRQGHTVTVYDSDPAVAASFDATVRVETGEWDRDLISNQDLVVTSPGVPESSPTLLDVADSSVPLVSEIEFASRVIECPYGAVTGTNGKTTVTNAAADMLSESGLNAVAAGNVGTALAEVADQRWDAIVIEVSSFQLRFIDTFRPHISAITNVAPDHLDWHGSFDAYKAAKANIYRNQATDDTVVFDADDPGAAACVEGAAPRRVPVSGREAPQNGSGRDGNELVVDGLRFPLPQLDAAYLADLAMAGVMARRLGASAEGIGSVIGSFATGEHRRQLVGRWGGVDWVNDSKATNPHAAVAAISAYPSVVLIAGGRNKGLDLSPMVAVPSLRRVIAIGEAATELQAAAPTLVDHQPDLAAAVATAAETAAPGDTVLMAPGCASFDMYVNYIARGKHFVELVTAMNEWRSQ